MRTSKHGESNASVLEDHTLQARNPVKEVTLVDDEDKPLTNVNSLGDHDSEGEVALVDNNMANLFLASKKVGYDEDDADYVYFFFALSLLIDRTSPTSSSSSPSSSFSSTMLLRLKPYRDDSHVLNK
nr:hypothetical protein [Tanacetum cinerariifolium]